MVLLFKLFEWNNGSRLLPKEVQHYYDPVLSGPRFENAFDALQSARDNTNTGALFHGWNIQAVASDFRIFGRPKR